MLLEKVPSLKPSFQINRDCKLLFSRIILKEALAFRFFLFRDTVGPLVTDASVHSNVFLCSNNDQVYKKNQHLNNYC